MRPARMGSVLINSEMRRSVFAVPRSRSLTRLAGELRLWRNVSVLARVRAATGSLTKLCACRTTHRVGAAFRTSAVTARVHDDSHPRRYPGIEAVGFGQSPGGLSESSRLRRVDLVEGCSAGSPISSWR